MSKLELTIRITFACFCCLFAGFLIGYDGYDKPSSEIQLLQIEREKLQIQLLKEELKQYENNK